MQVEENSKTLAMIEYEKQKILLFNKKNSIQNQQYQQQLNSCSIIDRQYLDESSFILPNLPSCKDDWDESILEESFTGRNQSFSKANIVESLKNKLIREDEAHQV